jgi:hypothetical protein
METSVQVLRHQYVARLLSSRRRAFNNKQNSVATKGKAVLNQKNNTTWGSLEELEMSPCDVCGITSLSTFLIKWIPDCSFCGRFPRSRTIGYCLFSRWTQYSVVGELQFQTQLSRIKSTSSHPIRWMPILILSSHVCLGLPNGLFPPYFLAKRLCDFSSIPCLLHNHVIIFRPNNIWWIVCTNCGAAYAVFSNRPIVLTSRSKYFCSAHSVVSEVRQSWPCA